MPLKYTHFVFVWVPYNTPATTISRCLNSVVGQTYRPLQVIVVDDGSCDNTASEVDRIIHNNTDPDLEMTFVRHVCNTGCGASRRDAVMEAKGDYIIAVDADDYIDSCMISRMVEETSCGNVDIVCAEMTEERCGRPRKLRYDASETFRLNDLRLDTLRFTLSKLIRTDLLRAHMVFTPGIDCWEDMEQVSVLLACEPVIRIIRESYYHYVIDPDAGSLTHSGTERILNQHLDVARRLQGYFDKAGISEKYAPFLEYVKFIAKVKFLRSSQALRHPLKRLRLWRDTFPEVNSHIMRFRHVGIIYRLAFAFAYQVSLLLPGKNRQTDNH